MWSMFFLKNQCFDVSNVGITENPVLECSCVLQANPGLRNVHAVFGTSIMALFLVHAVFGLQLGLSY
jgi:hypothetical protein